MSDSPERQQISKRGLNPNAATFIPNVNAATFVPGQAVHCSGPQKQGVAQIADEAKTNENSKLISNGEASRGNDKEKDASPIDSWDDDSAKPCENDQQNSNRKLDVPVPVLSGAPVLPVVEEDEDSGSQAEISVAKLKAQLKPKQYANDMGDAKEHVNVVFIGHVDAGKSTIGGHVMYLTGMVDRRTLEKYEKEAKEKNRETWYLSWALDTNLEERDKGKTVEVGRAYFETEKKHFTILDAPGHKSFVPNMISGASQADLAVLVISARKGEFETGFERGGQTREHAMLVKTAGVKYLLILVNKMDDPTVNWDEMRYKDIQDKLTPYLRKVGFSPKTDIYYMPCSGQTGAFLKDRPDVIGSWYSGPCFIEYLDHHLPTFSRDFEGPLRVVVVDKYNDMGTVILGKVESGSVQKSQSVLLMPNRMTVQVIQIWCDEEETEEVGSGQSIKMKLKGVEDSDILSGFILCTPDSPCHVGRIFDAEVVILEHRSIICSGYSCVLHIHAAVEEVTVKILICTIDKRTGEKKRSRFVRQDEKCIMRLESAELFCLESFKEFAQMGRFTLRDEGKTIAIGKVLKVVE